MGFGIKVKKKVKKGKQSETHMGSWGEKIGKNEGFSNILIELK